MFMDTYLWSAAVLLILLIVVIGAGFTFVHFTDKIMRMEPDWKIEKRKKEFFKRNHIEIMAVMSVLVCLDIMFDKLTDEEKICAKQAQLHLQGALDFQETKWIVEAGNFTKAAATRLNNEADAMLTMMEENNETGIPPRLRT